MIHHLKRHGKMVIVVGAMLIKGFRVPDVVQCRLPNSTSFLIRIRPPFRTSISPVPFLCFTSVLLHIDDRMV
jgi:hypothetical protein